MPGAKPCPLEPVRSPLRASCSHLTVCSPFLAPRPRQNMFVGMSGCLLPAMFRAIFGCCRKPTSNLAPEAEEPLLAEGADASEGAEVAEAESGKIKVSGLKGLFVVAAPAVRLPSTPEVPHAESRWDTAVARSDCDRLPNQCRAVSALMAEMAAHAEKPPHSVCSPLSQLSAR